MALTVPYMSTKPIHNASYAGPVARQRSADEFLSNDDKMIGKAMHDLSQGLGQLGEAIHTENIRKRELTLELELLNDLQTFQASSQEFHDNYAQSHQGKNAASAGQDGLKFYERGLGELQRKWQSNPRALLQINQRGGALALDGINSMRDYGNTEMGKWEDSTILGDQAQFTQFAANPHNPPEQIAQAYRALRNGQIAYYQRKGLDPASAAAKVDQLFNNGMRNHVINQLHQTMDQNPAEFERIVDGTPQSARLPQNVAAIADRVGSSQGVDPALVKAIIAAESNGQAGAVSKVGARGLMQLMPGTAKDLGVNPDDPEQNVRGGTKYISQMLKKYNGNLEYALAAYNWGPGHFDNWLKGGRKGEMPKETRNYVRKVIADYQTQKGNARRAGGGTPGGKTSLAQPVPGYSKISSGYGHRNTKIAGASTFHEAVDIPAPIGTPVTATMGGTVKVATNKGKNGNYIIIDGDDGRQHYYLHLNNFAEGLQPGDRVEKGTEIAAVGNTSTLKIGPHLDYRIKENGKFIDPEPFLRGAESTETAEADAGPGKPVILAENAFGTQGNVASDAYGIDPAENEDAEAGPGDDDGMTIPETAIDSTTFGDWILGDEAAMANAFLAPSDRIKLRTEYNKRQAAAFKAQQEELKAAKAEAEKQVIDFFYGAGELNEAQQFVNARRDLLSPADYEKYMKMGMEGQGPPSHSDQESLIEARNKAGRRDPDYQQWLDDEFRAFRLTASDYNTYSILGERSRAPIYKQAEQIIKLKTGRSEMNPNPVADLSYLQAMQDFDDWLDSEAGQKASDRERADMANRIGDNYRLISLEQNLLAVDAPLFLVGSRLKPDVLKTIKETNEMYEKGKLSKEQYDKERKKITAIDMILTNQTKSGTISDER